MPSARLVSEGVNDFVEVEGAIDNWFDARSIDGSYEIQLMLSAADNQTLKPSLFRHQMSGCDFAGPAGKNADQSNVAADCDGGYGLAEGAWASHLNDMRASDRGRGRQASGGAQSHPTRSPRLADRPPDLPARPPG